MERRVIMRSTHYANNQLRNHQKGISKHCSAKLENLG